MTQRAVLRRYQPRRAPAPTSGPLLGTFDQPHPVPQYPPASWFARPDFLVAGQRIEIMNDGRVYGYIVPSSPVDLGGGRTFVAPSSPSAYTRAMQGQVQCDDGQIVRVAVLGAGGHPDDPDGYVNPDRARAVVHVGHDAGGVWIAGALTPGATYADVAWLRRHSLSGDWRPTEYGVDLVGVGSVNVPGAALGIEPHTAPDTPAPRTTSRAPAGGRVAAAALDVERRRGFEAGVAAEARRARVAAIAVEWGPFLQGRARGPRRAAIGPMTVDVAAMLAAVDSVTAVAGCDGAAAALRDVQLALLDLVEGPAL
jgi:hypothetical protein